MNNVTKALEFTIKMMSNSEYDNILIPFIVGLDPEFIFLLPEKKQSTIRKLIRKGRDIIREKTKKEGDCILVYEGLLCLKNEDGKEIKDKTIVCEIVDTEIKYYQRFHYKNNKFHTKGVLFKVYDENKLTGYEEC